MFSSEISFLNMGFFIRTWKSVEWKSALTHHLHIKHESKSSRSLNFKLIVLWIGSNQSYRKCQSFIKFVFISKGRCWVGEGKIRFLLIPFSKALLSQILLSFFRYVSLFEFIPYIGNSQVNYKAILLIVKIQRGTPCR